MASFKKTTVTVIVLLGVIVFGAFPAMGEHSLPTPEPVSGRPVKAGGIIPADVLARVALLREEVDTIRFEMGKPKDSRTRRVATHAAPHEVYFQAITLYLKANRLALELTGSTGMHPRGVSPLKMRPFHVWKIVDAAYERILTVKRELGIANSIPERPQDPSTTPTDVGRAIVSANRQINLLLERRFSPSDVFQQVTAASRYAETLLARFPGAKTRPDPPPFERGKAPKDVLFRLADCYKRLETVAYRSGLEVLHLDTSALEEWEVQPGDVYDMATLLVSDLSYIHAQAKGAKSPRMVSYPGRKFPSHVYQQAGVLCDQLTALGELAEANPDWLER